MRHGLDWSLWGVMATLTVWMTGCHSSPSPPVSSPPVPPVAPLPAPIISPTTSVGEKSSVWAESLSRAVIALEQALHPQQGIPRRDQVLEGLEQVRQLADQRPGAALSRAMRRWLDDSSQETANSPVADWRKQAVALQPYCRYSAWALELLDEAQENLQRGGRDQAAFEIARALQLLQSASLEVACSQAMEATRAAQLALQSGPEEVATETPARPLCEEALRGWMRVGGIAWLLEGRALVVTAGLHCEQMAWSEVEQRVVSAKRAVEQAAAFLPTVDKRLAALTGEVDAVIGALHDDKVTVPGLLVALQARLDRLLREV